MRAEMQPGHGPENALTVSFHAMQRMRTTIEDFVQSYFVYAGLDPVKDLFKYLDILVWVEGTIYQLDEDNEELARSGECQSSRRLLGESVVPRVLEGMGLLDEDIRTQLTQGDKYWQGERKLCSAMLRGKLPKGDSPQGQSTGAEGALLGHDPPPAEVVEPEARGADLGKGGEDASPAVHTQTRKRRRGEACQAEEIPEGHATCLAHAAAASGGGNGDDTAVQKGIPVTAAVQPLEGQVDVRQAGLPQHDNDIGVPGQGSGLGSQDQQDIVVVPALFTLEEVLEVHEAKSFDYRVLHLLLHKLSETHPDPLLMEFLYVDELLVDIGDDLTDYEDDVEINSFNILRAFVHLYGPEAPLKLVERISSLEQRHEELLCQLPPHLQEHYWSRHRQAVEEGGSEGSGRWVLPCLILDEHAFRDGLANSTNSGTSSSRRGSTLDTNSRNTSSHQGSA